MRPREIRSLLTVCALLTLAVGAWSAGAAATGEVRVGVLGEGRPVPGVTVTLRPPRPDGAPIDSQRMRRAVTDAQGQARFPGLEPGSYVASLGCEDVPWNWLAGTIVTWVEAFAGRAARTTLTLRPAGAIRGRVVRGDSTIVGATMRADAPGSLSSPCAEVVLFKTDADGRYEIPHVPADQPLLVHARVTQGLGTLSVWDTARVASGDSIRLDFAVPVLRGPTAANVTFEVQDPDGKKTSRAVVTLLAVDEPGRWRYEAQTVTTPEDSRATFPELPPGRYFVRAMPRGDGKSGPPAWSTYSESLAVAAGPATVHIIKPPAARATSTAPHTH